MSWLQGLVSTERDGYIENRRGQYDSVTFGTTKDTKYTKGQQSPAWLHVILSCVSCLSWLTLTYDRRTVPRRDDVPVFPQR